MNWTNFILITSLTVAFQQPINLENELRKASEEIKRLREEASALRQENLQLKVSRSYLVIL